MGLGSTVRAAPRCLRHQRADRSAPRRAARSSRGPATGSGHDGRLPAADLDDFELEQFFGDGVQVVTYDDGSEERLSGDGRAMVRIPGIECAYRFSPPAAMSQTKAFSESLRIIIDPTES